MITDDSGMSAHRAMISHSYTGDTKSLEQPPESVYSCKPSALMFARRPDTSISRPSTNTTRSRPSFALPALPPRSPFRIRDSRISKGTSSASKSRHVQQRPCTETPHHSSTPSFRLSSELARLWKIKPDLTPKEPIQNTNLQTTDELLTQLLISLAVLESREFQVLSFDEVDNLKKQHTDLQRRISQATEQLGLKSKIKDISRILASLDRRRSGQVKCDQASRTVDELVLQLSSLQSEAYSTKFKLLQHTAAILSLGIQKLESAECMTNDNNSSPTREDELQAKDREIAELRSELEQITSTLDMMIRRTKLQSNNDDHTSPDSAYGKSTDDLTCISYGSETPHTSISRSLLLNIEKQLNNYKNRARLLEDQVERQQSISRSERKLRIQLRAAENERDVAEAQCQRLLSKVSTTSSSGNNNEAMDPQLEWLKAGTERFSEEADDEEDRKGIRPLLDKIAELELQLRLSEDQKEFIQVQLSRNARQIAALSSSRSNLELKYSKAQSQAATLLTREKSLKIELEQYRNEAFSLRIEKEKWRQAHKRESALNLQAVGQCDGNRNALLRQQYEQHMEEQRKSFEIQLRESQAMVDKYKQQCEQFQNERDQWMATSNDLEKLIREKMDALDDQHSRMNQLESELAQAQNAQQALSAREENWISKTAAMESKLEGMLMEFDRLTSTVMDLEAERSKHEQRIQLLMQSNHQLEEELAIERVKHFGQSSDTPATVSLRTDFKALVSDMKAEQKRLLEKEILEKKQLEKVIEDMKHERNGAKYDRVNKGVQTSFIP
ncbi:hypothetical protein EC973_007065 [Apophysomyces ossiformis]|uniref:Up-regulated during septation protein 1 domain-containing protein n=1 Tax=Apophysomyces ossiformis TaxID=679940 RepID=A0A8H7BXP2_9FUNG|nr:hypothetical protein EC973_007065 [Apophysomyces ossiformis]